MRKSFDALTIADDYMFCAVMQDAALCKKLLNFVLEDSVGTITEVSYQTTFERGSSKGIRLDIWAGDERGKLYDIEMQTTDQKNLAKRLRYYQSAIDVGTLNKGWDYDNLPDTFIIFFCTFDYVNAELPVYTFKTTCTENDKILLPDGITKVILNSRAAAKTQKPELQAFLEYMNGKKSNSDFIIELENKVNEVKQNDKRRREYMIMSAFEADARRVGILEGKQEGISEGSYQARLETAKNLIDMGLSIENIAKATGLAQKEVEKLQPKSESL